MLILTNYIAKPNASRECWKSSGEPKNGNDNGGYYGFDESNKKRVQVEISAYYVHSEILQNQRKAVSIMLLGNSPRMKSLCSIK